MTERGRAWVPAQFAALALVWGASFLFIRVALDGLSPVQVVFGRLACGALVLTAVMVATGRRWPRGARVWAHLTVIAVLLCVAPFLLLAWAGACQVVCVSGRCLGVKGRARCARRRRSRVARGHSSSS